MATHYAFPSGELLHNNEPVRCAMSTIQIGDDWFSERQGGLGRYFLELLRHLPDTATSSAGLVVGTDAVSQSTCGEVVAFAKRTDPLISRLRSVRAATLNHIREHHVDLIASHFAPYALPVVNMFRSLPHVVHFHGPWAGESGTEGASGLNSRVKKAMENVVYSSATRLVVLSRYFRDELVRAYRVPQERIRVVPGGIDTDRFNVMLTRAEARQILGWPRDRTIILAVRRHVKRMGLEEFIDAAKLIAAVQPDILILLGGSGPLSAALQMRIVEHGLQRNVKLLGYMEDALLPVAYRAADMTVVPSQSLEGFGLITLESLASGTPVYVTPVGGLPEIVDPFAPECIFRDGSPKEMAGVLSDVVRGLLPSPDETSCHSYVRTNFSWPQIAARVRAVYDEALHEFV
jgi:glycosyltransferase involved in cell wall biosynthesis